MMHYFLVCLIVLQNPDEQDKHKLCARLLA